MCESGSSACASHCRPAASRRTAPGELVDALARPRCADSAPMKDRSGPKQQQGVGRKKSLAKRRARKRHEEAQASKPESETAGAQALSYLAAWTRRDEGGWKFNKTRQTYLHRSWPDRAKIPNDDFKRLLPYLLSLQGPGRQRTLEQARGVAEDAEREDREEGEAQAALEAAGTAGDAGDGGGEAGEEGGAQSEAEASAHRRALLKIKRARALKVMQTLVASDEEGAAAS